MKNKTNEVNFNFILWISFSECSSLWHTSQSYRWTNWKDELLHFPLPSSLYWQCIYFSILSNKSHSSAHKADNEKGLWRLCKLQGHPHFSLLLLSYIFFFLQSLDFWEFGGIAWMASCVLWLWLWIWLIWTTVFIFLLTLERCLFVQNIFMWGTHLKHFRKKKLLVYLYYVLYILEEKLRKKIKILIFFVFVCLLLNKRLRDLFIFFFLFCSVLFSKKKFYS